jgi:glycosyltransferase involved in cell wall biosynthesis
VFDLTPLSPGGQTGGSGLVATSVVRELGRLAHAWELLLLTSGESHEELAPLDAPNVRRLCVLRPGAALPGSAGVTSSIRTHATAESAASATLAHHSTSLPAVNRGAAVALRTFVGLSLSVLPPRARIEARNALWRLRRERRNAVLLQKLKADLVVCPFTAVAYWHPRIPLVTIVHDLQHVAYPHFFSVEQRLNREAQIRLAGERATRLVCVSEYVRHTLVAFLPTLSSRASVIPHGVLHEWRAPVESVRRPRVFESDAYLLYPANFWPHKNHRTLFEALRRFKQSRPRSDLKLVCTGAPNAAMRELRRLADSQLGPGTVAFPGHLDEPAFTSLLDNCTALIYPSLYEGFGMPVLEAMARGKPVLCSRIGPLEEVGGDAACYFNPTDPDEMVQSIVSLSQDPPGTQARVAHGRARARVFGSAEDMAGKYLALFEELL